MKPTQPLQSIVDPFVKGIGGELVSELIGNKNPRSSADYLFRDHNVIAELKALENDSFGEPYRAKMANLTADWQRRGLLLVYGTARIDIRRLSPVCQKEWLDVLESSLQTNVVAKANRQIRNTKESLNLPSAKGILWVASDGNEDLQPNDVWILLCRLLQKTREDGTPQYSSVDSLAYFNPRMLVELPDSRRPALLWLSGARRPEDQEMLTFLQMLSDAWPKYVAQAQGTEVQRLGGETMLPEALESLRFLGVSPRMPRVQMKPIK